MRSLDYEISHKILALDNRNLQLCVPKTRQVNINPIHPIGNSYM